MIYIDFLTLQHFSHNPSTETGVARIFWGGICGDFQRGCAVVRMHTNTKTKS